MKKELKIKVATRADAEKAFSAYCTHARSSNLLLAAAALKQKKAMEEFEQDLAVQLKLAEGNFNALKKWARNNAAEFGDRRSIKTRDGVFGFKTGNPTLSPLGDMTWDDILKSMQDRNDHAFIRTKHELDKAGIMADRENLGQTGLARLGVCVKQAETFFCEAAAVRESEPIPQ